MSLSWSISSICFWKTTIFVLVLCAIIKMLRAWFICWNLALIGSWLSHILIFVLNSLKWDKSLSVCVLFNSFCLLVFASFICWTWIQSCDGLSLWYNLDNLLLCYTFVCFLVYFVFWSKLYLPLVHESLVHAYSLNIYPMTCFTFFDPIYSVNS